MNCYFMLMVYFWDLSFFCRFGETMTQTAVATSQLLNSRWLFKSEKISEKHDGDGEMISDPQNHWFHYCVKPRLDHYWGLIKVKNLVWWSFSVALKHLSCVFLQGFLQDLFLQHGKTITPKKLEEYTDTMVTGREVWDWVGGWVVSSLAYLHSGMFFFSPSRWKCLTKTEMADWISMTWPGTVRIV